MKRYAAMTQPIFFFVESSQKWFLIQVHSCAGKYFWTKS